MFIKEMPYNANNLTIYIVSLTVAKIGSTKSSGVKSLMIVGSRVQGKFLLLRVKHQILL